mmetsp:Transcript_18300/g.32559  ORF Transcript_18300/g.32559 Transcript_18300/m.32559 type:complete len:179 (-) Transcript_18300:418-954(-)
MPTSCASAVRFPVASARPTTAGLIRSARPLRAFTSPHHNFSATAKQRGVAVAGIGSDAVGGFLDLAKLVSAGGASKKVVHEELAYKLGQDVYADFGGWHLYLRDMKGTGELKMSQVLASALGSKMSAKGFDDFEVEKLLKSIPVSLGGGKKTVSLHDVLPSFCMQDLQKICSDYARDL